MRKFLGFVLLDLCFLFMSYGQELGFDPANPLQNISVSQWTADDGLSSNNVTNIFQDSRGLLWITSFNGIMIYDGERFELFDINSLDILETDGFYTVVEDEHGVIYLGSQGSGIVKYENDQFTILDGGEGTLPKSIPSLYISKSGVLYIGTNNQGLYKLGRNKISKIDIAELNKSTITRIQEDVSGRLWVATEGQGLFGLKGENIEKHLSIETGLLDNYVENLAYSSDDRLMIATTKGLQYLDPDRKLYTVSALSNVYINYLFVDEWNMTWAGTESGLVRWNHKLNSAEWLFGKRDIDLVRISSIIKDRENSIWLTSSRTGLIQLKESMLSNISRPEVSSNRVNIVHESWDGNLYIGTDQNQIDVYNGDTYSAIRLKTNLGGNGIRDIYHDRDGSFWLATYVGIIHVDGTNEFVYSTDTGMPANNFRTVLKDEKGDFWFGSRSGGLVKFRDGRILKIFNNQNELQSNFVLSVAESASGKILVGTHSGGLTVFDAGEGSKTYHLKVDDSGVLFFNIDMTSDTSALITANIGLIYFDGRSLRQVNLQSDRISKTYFDIVDDKKGYLWLTTNLGIIRIDKEVWNLYQGGAINQLPYQLFDENDGMNNSECTGATRSIRSSNGEVLIPTLGGICVVQPKRPETDHQMPDVSIRNVFVDKTRFNSKKNNNIIEPGSIRYVFEFAVLSYTAPERNQYRYQLVGLEDSWSQPDYAGRVEYTNLPPGKYTFKVIGSNGSNIWNTEGASYSFRVKPFFYQTIWFYLLILLFLILIFFIFYRWRTSFINRQNIELRKVNAELDRFVYSASHEIRSPLSSILGLINLARMGDSNKRLQYFDHIERSVNRLDDFIRDIVDYSRNARLGVEVDIVDFKSIIANILDDISHTENFEKIRCDLKYEYQNNFYSDPKRLKVVLSNIITNAFKHHEPDRVDEAFVSIELLETTKGVRIAVNDNGPGIGEGHQSKMFDMFYRATTANEGSGLGLYIVEETLEKLQGAIEVKSKENEGSSFIMELRNLEALYSK